ncbi:MAG: Uma2 family endonuclease [Gemmatimonadaceae bacterium]
MAEQIAYMGSQARLMTAEELLRNDIPNKATELVRGVLVVREPPGGWHGYLSLRLGSLMDRHVSPRNAGMLFGQDTGFLIEREPDTVRAPDLAFVRAERTQAVGRKGYVPFAPDLAVEILSPGDRPGEVLAKVADWLRAGTRVVWVIDPDRALAHVHRADGTISIVREEGALEGEDVLPGFSCALNELFTPLV